MITRLLTPEIACERLIRTLRNKGITDERVLEAFKKVPRHEFVDGAMYAQAYDDNALPIGKGQTISQPYIVALMTQLLELKPPRANEKILEIGTGSGFQAAILAQFTKRIYTIERHAELGEIARKRLRAMGFENIVFKVGDGTRGWVQHSPFDKIIVTAGAPAIPDVLCAQLAEGGRMIIPVGARDVQSLQTFEKKNGALIKLSELSVVFVPLVGEKGWDTK
jgi:protein-L-isoaspartate(D-aspartate) O-methyltransferase